LGAIHVNSFVFPAVLIARRFGWLHEVDPAIAGLVLMMFAALFVYGIIHCSQIYSCSDSDDDESRSAAVGYGVGYLIGALILGGMSLAFFADSQSNHESMAYGLFGGSRKNSTSADQFSSSDQLRSNSSQLADLGNDASLEVRRPDHAGDFDRAKARADEAFERHRAALRGHLDEADARRPSRANDPTSRGEQRSPTRGSSASRAELVPESLPPTPAVALPFFQYALNQAQKSKYVGGRSGQDFVAHGPAGSVLVGIKLGLIDDAVTGLQPIYQLQDQYVSGEALGDMGDTTKLLLARPGYVVGGVLVSNGPQSLALQLRFLKYDAGSDGLDVFDQYDSARVGRMAGAVAELDGDGAMVVGLFGQLDSNRLSGFGVAGLKPTSGESPVSTGSDPRRPPPATPPVNDYRVWYSSDRSFSVEAKLQQFKNGKAVLEKRDGSVVEVDPTRLCPEDNEYLATRE